MASDGPHSLQAPAIVWFRDDLRLHDNPALTQAVASGQPLILLFIQDEASPGLRRHGGASRWWLHGSLLALSQSISERGSVLHLVSGKADDILFSLVQATEATAVYWNRRYGEAERTLDAAIKEKLIASGVTVTSFKANLLNEPWEITSKAGTPMKVFTPYWRNARERGDPAPPLPAPERLFPAPWPEAIAPQPVTLDSLDLLPTKPDWAGDIRDSWKPGEAGAKHNLQNFLASSLHGYGENRNRPDKRSTSRLSPHLRFGEISPRQIFHATRHAIATGAAKANDRDVEKFLAEVGWREFSYHLLYAFPQLASSNFQSRFDAFPWRDDPKALQAWQKGQTGYPIVDAGMRELWRTGWMHNRVRMVVGSFLVKHLLIDWRLGEHWFWDTLLDADPANNAASWQWIAGSGADAAPYYRIFAPILQGEKFDPNGDYVRRYVPELANLPNAFLHKPWEAPHPILDQAGIRLGVDYPHPVIAHSAARVRALAAFKSLAVKEDA